MTTALGLRAFTGWAIAITLGGDGREPKILDRHRISLQAENIPAQFYHVASDLEAASGLNLISQAIEASEAVAFEALAGLMKELGSGGAVDRAGLVVGKTPPSTPPRHAHLSHAGLHWAEGEAYRWTLLQAAERAGLHVTLVAESDLGEPAAERLGLTTGEVPAHLKRLGLAVGPPWTQREKSAAMAAWLAIASEG